jgi:hypothetical protein
VLVAVLIGGLTAGCGPSREPNKYKDQDRPKPTGK